MAQTASARSAAFGLFVRDFDDPASDGVFGADGVIVLDDLDGAAAASPPPDLAITQEQLDEARASAHAQGLAAGRAEAEAAQDAERRTLLNALLDQLRDADAQIRGAVDEAGAGLARLVLASLAAGFPSLCARHGAAELARFTREVTDMLADEPHIVIRVHPTMLAALDDCLSAIEPERRAAILVEPRDALTPGDARIAWRHGLAVRDAASLQARLADILAPLGLAPVELAPEPPAPKLRTPAPPAAPHIVPQAAPPQRASPSQPTRFDVATAS